MRVGLRENNSGVSKIVELDSAMIWDFRRSYDEALRVFGNTRDIEWGKILNDMKAFDDATSYPECIILYNSKSELAPVLFETTKLSQNMADKLGVLTTVVPDVIELFRYDDRLVRSLFDNSLITGYIDVKDFDAMVLTYSNIPETSGDGVKKVMIDLSKIQ